MASFVRKTLSKAHTKVIENIAERVQMGDRPDSTATTITIDGAGGLGCGDDDDGVYGQGQDHQQFAATRRRNAANLNLAPVYGHRAAASETDLSPTSLSPNSLAPTLQSGQYHTHQDSWSSTAGGWPLQPPHPPHGFQDQGRDRQQGSSLSQSPLGDDGSIPHHSRSHSLQHPHMAELQ